MDYTTTMFFAILSSLGFVILGIFKNLYIIHRKAGRSFFLLLEVWFYRITVNTFILYFGTGILREYGISRLVLILSAFLRLISAIIFDTLWYYLEQKYYDRNMREQLIISTNITAHQEIIAQITENEHANTTVISPENIKYDEDLQHYASIFIIGDIGKQILQDIFDHIRFASTRFFHFSEGQFVQDVVYSPCYIANSIAIEYTHSTLDGWSLIFKRLFDIVVGSIALILLSPVFLIVAIAITLDSKGPILFFQKRVGK